MVGAGGGWVLIEACRVDKPGGAGRIPRSKRVAAEQVDGIPPAQRACFFNWATWRSRSASPARPRKYQV
ncbi:MAG: hypothetical protein PHU85_13215, partial [Phycisphaerae bacterium]|nr:hypothetical protein [Phycisphaerae bacterium]